MAAQQLRREKSFFCPDLVALAFSKACKTKGSLWSLRMLNLSLTHVSDLGLPKAAKRLQAHVSVAIQTKCFGRKCESVSFVAILWLWVQRSTNTLAQTETLVVFPLDTWMLMLRR